MVIIGYNKQEDNKFFNIRINNESFSDGTIDKIKELPVRIYNKENKSWNVPIVDYYRFLKKIDDYDNIIIKHPNKIKNEYENLLSWRDEQIRLKNIYNLSKEKNKENIICTFNRYYKI